EVLLEIAESLEDGLQSVSGSLDHVFERRNALEEVLVERDLLLRLPRRFVHDPDARKDEQLRVAAPAELLLVVIAQTADLAVQQRSRSSVARASQRSAAPQRSLGTRRLRALRTVILVKPLARLLAQPPCVHHLYEQRARAVFRIAEPILEDSEDREARI